MPSFEQTLFIASGFGYRPDFAAWLRENWTIWLRFCEEADKVRRRGRGRYAARTIAEYIRHETALRETGGEFKLNDHFTPGMARLYMATRPDAQGFFETREQREGATQ